MGRRLCDYCGTPIEEEAAIEPDRLPECPPKYTFCSEQCTKLAWWDWSGRYEEGDEDLPPLEV